MASAFDADFSSVRVHDDAEAGALATSTAARAFTVGEHIVFAPGRYEPGTVLGDALLAHELAHVLQQEESAPTRGLARDLEADANAATFDALVSLRAGSRIARRTRPSARTGLRIQRCPVESPVLEGEEAQRLIEERGLRIVADFEPERAVTGSQGRYHVAEESRPERGDWPNTTWHAITPRGERIDLGLLVGFQTADFTFSEAGRWHLEAEVMLWVDGWRRFVTLTLDKVVEELETVAAEAFAQTTPVGPHGYERYRAALEMQAIEAGGGVTRDQSLGGDFISLEGSAANPVRPTSPYRRHSYAVHLDPATPSDRRPARFRWYAVPEKKERYPSGYGGHLATRYLGRLAFELGEGSSATFHIEVPNLYTIVCEKLDRDGNILGTVRYRQSVMTEEQAEDVAKVRREMRRSQVQLRAIAEGSERPLRAVHTSSETGHSTELILFAGPARTGGDYKLIDVTAGVRRSEYSGDDLGEAVDDFDSANEYPPGIILLEGTGLRRRQLRTNGESALRSASSGFGLASLGLAVVGVISLFTPAAVAAPYIFAAAAVSGGVSSGLSLADELRNNDPDRISIAIDVAGIAVSMIGLGEAAAAASASRAAARPLVSSGQRMTLRGKALLLCPSLTLGGDVVQGVLISYQAAGEIDRILADPDISRDEKVRRIVRILAMIAIQGGLIAYGARDLRGARSRVSRALRNEPLARNLQADTLYHLDALDDAALPHLRGLDERELANVARITQTDRGAARELSRRYGEDFIAHARTGRFSTLEELAENVGRSARARAHPDPHAGGARAAEGEAQPTTGRVRTEQGELDIAGRPSDALALEMPVGVNAHGEPHVFHMTEDGRLFRCSDVCVEIVKNTDSRITQVRARAARLQRSLQLGRNWREDAAAITRAARRLRDRARRLAEEHQRRLRAIARLPQDSTRRAERETARQGWLTKSRQQLEEAARSLENRISTLEQRVGIASTVAAAPPARPLTPALQTERLRYRYDDILSGDRTLQDELQGIQGALSDPAQAIDVRRRLDELERRLVAAAEERIPAAIARAREMQLAAGNGLLTVRIGRRSAGKCVAHAGGVRTISGGNAVAGFEQRTREVLARGEAIGHSFAPDNFDQSVSSVLNQGRPPGERVPARGTARASHAEKQAALAAPGQPIGVSLPMCFDCYEFFIKYARSSGRPQVVADPDMVRVFYPDGRVLSPSRSGTTPLGGAQP